MPNLYNKNIVNHKDGKKKNCKWTNLEWVTSRENVKHALENGLSITDKNKFKSKRVAKIHPKTNKIIKIYNSINEASKDLNCSHNSISNVINGKSKTCKGFKWKVIK